MRKKNRALALMLSSVMAFGFGLSSCSDPADSSESDSSTGSEATRGTLEETASVSFANGSVSWTAVTGAESYEVTVYSGTQTVMATRTVTGTTLDVSALTPGSYTVGIVSVAADKESSGEKKYNFSILAELSTPTGFTYEDGKVSWGAVKGATQGYLVKATLKSDGSVAIAEKTVTVAEVDVSALAAGTYTLSVTAKAVEGQALASKAAAYEFTVEPQVVQLATPSGGALDVENRKVTWTAVENATSYKVVIIADGETVIEKQVNVTEIDVSTVEETEFTVSVVAVSSGEEVDSEAYVYTAKVQAVKLATPTDIATDSAQNKLSWTAVAGTDVYRLIVKQGSDVVVDEELIETEYDISALGKGEYSVSLQALADVYDVFRADSETASQNVTVASLGAYQNVSDLRIDGGYIKWATNNARDYEIVVTEKGGSQALDVNGIKAADNAFMLAATGLSSGDYTISVTPKDNRHDTEAGTAATYDFTLMQVAAFDAAAIAQFSGSAPAGEHGKVELVTLNGKQVAKVTPTADGWGRIGSGEITVNFDKNPVLYIDVEALTVGGFHAQIQVSGNNLSILRDGAKLADVAVSMKGDQASSLTGTQNTIIRLGVDNSSTTTSNDAEAYYNGCRVMYITEYEEPITGTLEAVESFEISNGMDIQWSAVENADSYNVTLLDKETGDVIVEKTAQTGISYRARDLAEGEYTISVSAFNSLNAGLEESEAATYDFQVKYLANYDAEAISQFSNVLLGSVSLGYDEDNDTAILNSMKNNGYGAIAPSEGVTVNLSNRPFAVVDAASIDYGYLIRGLWAEEGSSSSSTLVLRNDTVGSFTDTNLYIELWKKADQNNAAVYGTGSYSFGMGYLAGDGNQGQVVLNGIRIVEITEIEVLDPSTKSPLAAPSGATESKGTLSATPVSGNSEYTPKYSATITEKGGDEVLSLTGLSSPSVNLATAGLVSGKTYEVVFKALGDDVYFTDSEDYKVEVTYTEAYALTDFSGLDYTTMADKKGGEATLTGEDGSLTSTVNNGGWGYNFFNVDVSTVLETLNANKDSWYMQWSIDVDVSTAGANIATRFYNPTSEEVVGTGHGDSDVQGAFLTKEWSDKVDDNGVIWFAFGQGGASVSGATEKVVVCTSIKFVKFDVKA